MLKRACRAADCGALPLPLFGKTEIKLCNYYVVKRGSQKKQSENFVSSTCARARQLRRIPAQFRLYFLLNIRNVHTTTHSWRQKRHKAEECQDFWQSRCVIHCFCCFLGLVRTLMQPTTFVCTQVQP